MDAGESDGESPAPRPSEETTLPAATATLRSWAAAPFRYLARSLAAVLPWPVAAAGFPAADDDGDNEHPKLFFTPDVASSPSSGYSSTWKARRAGREAPVRGRRVAGRRARYPSDASSARPRPPPLLAAGGVLRLQPFHRGTPAAARHQSAGYNHVRYGLGYRLTARRPASTRPTGRAPVLPLRPRPCRGGRELRGPRARRVPGLAAGRRDPHLQEVVKCKQTGGSRSC